MRPPHFLYVLDNSKAYIWTLRNKILDVDGVSEEDDELPDTTLFDLVTYPLTHHAMIARLQRRIKVNIVMRRMLPGR